MASAVTSHQRASNAAATTESCGRRSLAQTFGRCLLVPMDPRTRVRSEVTTQHLASCKAARDHFPGRKRLALTALENVFHWARLSNAGR